MTVEKIVFSPTGGTQRVADVLAASLSGSDENIIEHDLSDPFLDESGIKVNGSSIALVAMPCFGGRVPAVAMERLGRIKANNAKCVVVIVYGNRAYDDALLELKEGATEAGFDVIAAVSAIAEHSIMHQFATGEPKAEETAKLSGFARQILSKLHGEVPSDSFAVPGNSPYKKAAATPLVPKVSKRCTSCGTCAEKCPVTAINTVDFAADKNICIACMRCIEICPHEARSVNKVMVKVAAMAIKGECTKKKEPELFL